jgi:hypothetical protein
MFVVIPSIFQYSEYIAKMIILSSPLEIDKQMTIIVNDLYQLVKNRHENAAFYTEIMGIRVLFHVSI